jgi:hypothetical protein
MFLFKYKELKRRNMIMTNPVNLDLLNASLWERSQNTQNLSAGNNTIIGGSGKDIIKVAGNHNTISAGAGDDEVVCIGDDNTINAGDGNNLVASKGSRTSIITGSGKDTINTDGSNNLISSGAGNDEILSYGDKNIIDGGEGNNLIFSKGSGNKIVTGSGNDNIVSLGDNNKINAGNGDNRISSIGNYNSIKAGNGNDKINFSGRSNLIDGGNGNNIFTDLGFKDPSINVAGRGVWGDPHYSIIGSNGKPIDFTHNGVAYNTYDVFSADGVEIDGLYTPYANAPCVITKSTIKIGADQIIFDVNGKAQINGKDVTQGAYTLSDGTKITISNGVLSISKRDGNGQIDIKADGNSMTIDPSGEFSNMSGILGTAIAENRTMTEAESESFNLKNRGNWLNPFNTIVDKDNPFVVK